MSTAEKKPSKITLTAFLILILSTTDMPPILKYPMLAIATISFIIVAVQLYHEFKANKISKAKK